MNNLYLVVLLIIILEHSVATKPNILFIIADDMSPILKNYIDKSHIMYHKTPHITSLMDDSLSFLNAHAQISVCGPSRASLLTGLRPDYTKIYNFDKFIPNKHVTMPMYFKRNGYNVQLFGKVFHPHIFFGSDYYSDHATNPLKAYDKNGNNECKGKLYCNVKFPTDVKTVDAFKEYIDDYTGDKPWFSIVGLRRPHSDFAVPKHFLNRINMQKDTYETDFPEIYNVTNFRNSLAYYECRKLNKKKIKKKVNGNKLKTFSN